MKRWIASLGFLSIVLSLLAGCGAGSEKTSNPSAPNATAAAVFAERGCAGCHGADGQGLTISTGTSADNPPTVIPALTAPATVAELTTIIETSMPPQNPSSCVGDCASQLAQYIFDTFTTKPGSAQTGAQLYVERCASCHGANGMGMTIGTVTIAPLTDPATVAELNATIAVSMPPTAAGSCTGTCSSQLAQYIFDNFTNKTAPPPPAANGAALYAQHGCVTCHGADGKGPLFPFTYTQATKSVAVLAADVARMSAAGPVLAPATGPCTGTCATTVAQHLFDNLAKPAPTVAALVTDPVDGLPTGDAQFTALCARLAARNVNDRVRTAFCGATRPTITSLTQLQAALGLAFPANPQAGRNNNGNPGNGPAFALTGHSSSLVLRSVSAINPRAVIFTPPTGNAVPRFVAMGFVRGDQFAEIVAHDSNNNVLDFYLVRFTQACNATNSCTPGDLLTPAIESNWTSLTIYDEGDLKNTTVDCTQCHQPGGPATQRILRMQELQNPWNHWFRDNRAGGQALLADYSAAKGNEGYAGIPGALISSSDPALLEDLVRDNGFGNQPNQFNSGNIENQVNQAAGQPRNNDVPGQSAAWNTIFNRAVQGLAIPVPYHDIKITEAATLATMTQAYQSFRAGTLPADSLPDLRNVFKTSRLFEIGGIAPRPGLDGAGIVTEMCTQCHNSSLDQTVTRARFNVNLAAMSNLTGGVLTATERNAEIGLAIRRLSFPANDVRRMPPESLKTLSAADIGLVRTYLCSQASAPIPECAN